MKTFGTIHFKMQHNQGIGSDNFICNCQSSDKPTIYSLECSAPDGDNVTVNSCEYTCGACREVFLTVCNLHQHIQTHVSIASYSYNLSTNIAYPKFGFISKETQTLVEDLLFVESEAVDQESKISPVTQHVENGNVQKNTILATLPVSESETAIGIGHKRKKKKERSAKFKKSNVKEFETELGVGTIANVDEVINNLQEHIKGQNDDKKYEKNKSELINQPKSANYVLSDMAVILLQENEMNDELTATNTETTSLSITQKPCSRFEKKLTTKTKHKRDKNILKAISDDAYTCKECNEIFNTARKFSNHKKQQHKNVLSYECNICNVWLKTNEKYQDHMKLHINKKETFNCELCGEVLKSKESMEKHNLMHQGVKPHKCPQCDYTCRLPHQLKLHLVHHTGVKTEQCEICGKAFFTKPKLKDHLRYCRKDQHHKCGICSKGFPTGSGLRKHMFTHTGEKPFICDICGFGTTKPASLKYHIRTHTGEKPYKCDECGLNLATRTTLVTHKRTHTQEKPYVCSYCSKAFNSKWNLTTHLRQHTGEKPYKCKRCGQGFKQNVLRKSHMRTHLDEDMPLSTHGDLPTSILTTPISDWTLP